ncbi:thioredoxin family protein [Roseateles cavernae]|uniref:thioredoxin family protein n=1 Tax=Roseateles cavernae TaxID=3153578 RepID=UPI003D80F298
MMTMSKKTWISALLLAGASLAQATAVVGQPAPAFSISDSQGKTVSLADYKGKHVVLEWVNPGCPFVKKHYDSGNMPATQKSAADKGVVWLAVSSTAKSASDYLPPPQLEAWLTSKQAVPKATLMDDDGKLGRAYGARTTPHLYVIDPAGTLVYAGAIDSKPTANPADIKTATNYVSQALGEVLAGKPVSRPNSTAYGCTIKYAS